MTLKEQGITLKEQDRIILIGGGFGALIGFTLTVLVMAMMNLGFNEPTHSHDRGPQEEYYTHLSKYLHKSILFLDGGTIERKTTTLRPSHVHTFESMHWSNREIETYKAGRITFDSTWGLMSIDTNWTEYNIATPEGSK